MRTSDMIPFPALPNENKIPSDKELIIEYLDSLFSTEGPKLVGKCLKRFEIIENRELLKKDIKELIYEEFRDLKEIAYAFGQGVELSRFRFVKPKKEQV